MKSQEKLNSMGGEALSWTEDRYTRHNTSSPDEKYVKWGIIWHAPLLMCLYAIGGFALAVGHHFYYVSLHTTRTGTAFRQQFAIASGTATSVLIVALLRSATTAAYNQYIWVLARKKFYKLGTLDKLFALTTDPTGFLSLEMLRYAKLAVMLATISWITPIAGIAPPASLSVVPGWSVERTSSLMSKLDWNSRAFYELQEYWSVPSPKVINLATQSALSRGVVPISPPAANSSFALQFYGPSIKCSAPNAPQNLILDYYGLALVNGTNALGLDEAILTQKLMEEKFRNETLRPSNTNLQGILLPSYSMLVLSAFAPYAGSQGWLYGMVKPRTLDQFNNWDAALPWHMDEMGGEIELYIEDEVIQTLYLQTATDRHVCTMGSASYHVDFEFENGAQKAVNYSITDFEPLVFRRSSDGSGNTILPGPYTGTYHTTFELSYMSIWESFTSMVSGNISLAYIGGKGLDSTDTIYNLSMRDTSSRALLTGLSACDEIVNNYWDKLPLVLGNEREKPATFFNRTMASNNSFSNQFMYQPSWMCRNRTLPRAVEDLFANITISMLSSASLNSLGSDEISILQRTTQNVYRYDQRNLLISYAIATGLTLIAVAVGIFSFLDNGVAHSISFSAIVATTRNPRLDRLTHGHSLGALPLDDDLKDVKLKFGEVNADDVNFGRKRLGFGFKHEVDEIEKKGLYY